MHEIQKSIELLLTNQESLQKKALSELSNLPRSEGKGLKEVWKTMTLEERRRLIRLMSKEADDNFRLDFSTFFIEGLSDTDAEVRRLSINALWENESFRLVRPFLKLLRHDQDANVRASAAAALGRFVLQGEMDYLSAERLLEIVDTLCEIISEPSLALNLRCRAIESVGNSSDKRVQSIIKAAYAEPSNEMRISALHAMGATADDAWIGTICAELLNENSAFRFEAARAAGDIANQQAVSPLIGLVSDEEKDVREMAAWALGQIGGARAIKALKALGNSADSSLRRIARDSLAELALLDDKMPMFLITPEMENEQNEEDEEDQEDQEDEQWEVRREWEDDDKWEDENEWNEQDEWNDQEWNERG